MTNDQIRCLQTALRAAGIRQPKDDRRYRLLLAQYKQPNGKPVTSCKQLNNMQMTDILAICEARGWRMPGKPSSYCRDKAARECDCASYAVQTAIQYLAGDMGWNDRNMAGFVFRITKARTDSVAGITPKEGFKIIEAFKAMIGRQAGKQYNNLTDIKKDMEIKDGQTSQV